MLATYQVDSLAHAHVAHEELDRLEHDLPGDHRVGCSDGGDYISSHRFDVEPRLRLNREDVGSDVGAGGDKVHSGVVVFVPHEVLVLPRLSLRLQLFDALLKDLRALLDAPHRLVLDATGDRAIGGAAIGGAQLAPLERPRRLPLAPELIHGEQVVDVPVEQFSEELLGVVVALLRPLSGRNS